MDSRMKNKRWQYSLTAGVVALLAACGGGSEANMDRTPEVINPIILMPVKYAVGGTVSGLGPGVALTLSLGSEKLTVAANGNFAFPTKIETGSTYSVSASVPAGYTCRVSEAAGVIGAGEVSKIAVACAPVVLAGMVSALQMPLAVAGDGGGNLYVIDDAVSGVIKISALGATTVVAGGSGRHGYVDGAGAGARFGFQGGDLFLDAQGNIIVADGCNDAIRKISAAGEVSTLVGKGVASCARSDAFAPLAIDGAGKDAQLGRPVEIISDGAGGALALDYDNAGAVRKISAAGVVSTQTWRNPNPLESALNFIALARGGEGTLYLADNRMRIWKDDAGTLVLLAGSAGGGTQIDGAGAAARLRGIAGMVVAADGNLYVADGARVRKVTPAGVVSTLAGSASVRKGADGQGAAATFGALRSIGLDGAGLVVLDGTQGNLRRVSLDGAVSTVAATAPVRDYVDGAAGAARFHDFRSLSADADGNLFLVDSIHHVLRKVAPDGTASTVGGKANVAGTTDGALATALFNAPHTVAAGRDGLIWVAQATGLRKIQNGVVTTVAPDMGITDMTIDGDGNAIVADERGAVVRVTPAGETTVLLNGYEVGTLLKRSDVGFEPWGMVMDAAGNLYVSDGITGAVYKRAKSGELSLFAGTPMNTVGDVEGPAGTATFGFYDYSYMAIDDKGNLYISGQGRVRMISPAGVVSTPDLGWGNASVTALAYAKGKLFGMTRYAVLQAYLP